ncbi:MAG: hypothetical protein SFV15_00805 [Polyangiaceae bacterium]|nr:hypothetical protein [Polyangiaceae bacterium]
MNVWHKYLIETGGIAALLGSAIPAGAVECSTLTPVNPVYGTGGSAVTSTLKRVAVELAKLPDNDPGKVTIFYADNLAACPGYKAFQDQNPAGLTYKYWNAAGVESTCTVAITPVPFDFAHMGNDIAYCGAGYSKPADIGDFGAPVQTLNIITAKNSSQTSISAAALYFAYGFKQSGLADPWTLNNGASLVRRSATSFVSLLLADAIGVPNTKILGTPANPNTNQQVIIDINTLAVNGVEAPLGYASGSAVDAAIGTANEVKTLAYQHKDQTCGYLPDSNPTVLDKRNVREGRYFLWAPGHFYGRVTPGTNTLTNPRVANLFGWFDGSIPAPGFDALEVISKAGDIPQCAMRVNREGVLGAISSFAPPEPCGCFFEKAATGAVPASCTPCGTDNTICAGTANPVCRRGYCEAY